MKKKLIPILATALVLAGLVGALVYLNANPVEEEAEETEAAVYVFGADGGLTLKSVQVTNETGSFTLLSLADVEGAETSYTVQGLEELPINSSYLINAMNNCASLTAKQVIEEEAEDLSVYGLTNPRATAVILAEERGVTLLVGNEAPSNEGTYVKTEGDPAVYLVSNSYVERLLVRDLDYLSKNVTGGSSEETRLVTATLSGTVREQPIVIRPLEESTEFSGMTLTSHQIVEPVQADLDTQYGLADLMSAFGLASLEVTAAYPDEAALEQYGLAEPYSILEIRGEELEPFTLSASAVQGDGTVYLMSSERPVIYNVSADSVPWLEAQVFDLRSKMLVLPYINDVVKVTVETPGNTYVFQMEYDEEEEENHAYYNGEELDIKNYKQFYQTLISASYSEYTEDMPEEGAPFLLRYTYEYADSRSDDVVTFYEGAARRVFLALNDEEPHYVQSTYVDRVLTDVEKLVAGEDVKSYL